MPKCNKVQNIHVCEILAKLGALSAVDKDRGGDGFSHNIVVCHCMHSLVPSLIPIVGNLPE